MNKSKSSQLKVRSTSRKDSNDSVFLSVPGCLAAGSKLRPALETTEEVSEVEDEIPASQSRGTATTSVNAPLGHTANSSGNAKSGQSPTAAQRKASVSRRELPAIPAKPLALAAVPTQPTVILSPHSSSRGSSRHRSSTHHQLTGADGSEVENTLQDDAATVQSNRSAVEESPRHVVHDVHGNMVGSVPTIDDANCRKRMLSDATAGPTAGNYRTEELAPPAGGQRHSVARPRPTQAMGSGSVLFANVNTGGFERSSPRYRSHPVQQRRTRPDFLLNDTPHQHAVHVPTGMNTAASLPQLSSSQASSNPTRQIGRQGEQMGLHQRSTPVIGRQSMAGFAPGPHRQASAGPRRRLDFSVQHTVPPLAGDPSPQADLPLLHEHSALDLTAIPVLAPRQTAMQQVVNTHPMVLSGQAGPPSGLSAQMQDMASSDTTGRAKKKRVSFGHATTQATSFRTALPQTPALTPHIQQGTSSASPGQNWVDGRGYYHTAPGGARVPVPSSDPLQPVREDHVPVNTYPQSPEPARPRQLGRQPRPIRSPLVSSFSKHQLERGPQLRFDGGFLSGGEPSELRRSGRRFSFTAAVAPEELIEDFHACGLVAAPQQGLSFPGSGALVSSTDLDIDSVGASPDLSTRRSTAPEGPTGSANAQLANNPVPVEERHSSRDPPVQGLPARAQGKWLGVGNAATASQARRAEHTPPAHGSSNASSSRSMNNTDSDDRQLQRSPTRSSSLVNAMSHPDEDKSRSPPTRASCMELGCGASTFMCLRWFFSWPIHGERGRLLTRIFLSILAWAALATITGKSALPGADGFLFAISVVIAAAALGGYIVRQVHLPPLLGMLLAGFLLRNVYVVDVPSVVAGGTTTNDSNISNVTMSPLLMTAASGGGELTSNLRSSWSSALRSVALVIILVRAGLGLNPSVLKRAKFVIMRLAFLPCLVEASVDAVLANLLLDFPWAWGYMLGFVIAAVSPAVVVPSLLGLQEREYGIAKGIPTLIIAAASFDDVIAISGFGIALGLVFSTGGSLAFNIIRGPLELLAGIVGGTAVGVIAWYIPSSDKTNSHRFRNRIIFLLFGGLTAVFGTRLVHFTGAGALGSLVMAFVAGRGWPDEDRKMVARSFALLWHFAQPMLFGLIGAEIDRNILGESFVGTAIGILWIGMLFRVIVSACSVVRYNLTLREKLFVALAWLPKATVQAAIGSVALDTATEQGGTPEQIALGRKVLTIAVLVIVFTAPIGSIAISLSGPRLLAKGAEKAENDTEQQQQQVSRSGSEVDQSIGSSASDGRIPGSAQSMQESAV
ncbi:uncharacterized protein LOC135805795 isoform X1 [Sycon ciliatum]|uniref:uncharacterized protein LOC135805795 isoform X1 n=1 Tax=Sycon ciliatum TaxID=27933 RepID=UPI0031F71478